jgi:hypothetical protein
MICAFPVIGGQSGKGGGKEGHPIFRNRKYDPLNRPWMRGLVSRFNNVANPTAFPSYYWTGCFHPRADSCTPPHYLAHPVCKRVSLIQRSRIASKNPAAVDLIACFSATCIGEQRHKYLLCTQ